MQLQHPGNLLYFLGVSAALTAAPGPDVLFLASQGVAGGPRAGLAAALGLSSGLLVHTTLTALGVSAVFAASPAAFTALKLAGTAYLLWLALGAFREKGSGRAGAAVYGGSLALYRKGVVMNLLNPKVALFFLALLPQFVDPAKGGVRLQMLKLGLVFMAQVIVIFGAIGYLSGRLGNRLPEGLAVSRAIPVFKGTVYLALAAFLLAASK
jgi:threonine/homoserine/homoserine lactone efflux protein